MIQYSNEFYDTFLLWLYSAISVSSSGQMRQPTPSGVWVLVALLGLILINLSTMLTVSSTYHQKMAPFLQEMGNFWLFLAKNDGISFQIWQPLDDTFQ